MIRAILIPGFMINLVSFLLIKSQVSWVTPEILQDVNPAVGSRQLQRYNKSMQHASSPFYFLFFCMEVGLIIVMRQVEGEYIPNIDKHFL